jgi:hypothetical protein
VSALVLAVLTGLAALGVGAMPPPPGHASASATMPPAPAGSPATTPVVRIPLLSVRPALATSRPKLVVKQGRGLWRAVASSAYGIGDGFLGGHMACGGRLTRTKLTVAYRYLHTGRAELRCGDRVQIRLAGTHGPGITVTVTDAGPFVGARVFDLGPGACRALGVCGIPRIEWRHVAG